MDSEVETTIRAMIQRDMSLSAKLTRAVHFVTGALVVFSILFASSQFYMMRITLDNSARQTVALERIALVHDELRAMREDQAAILELLERVASDQE